MYIHIYSYTHIYTYMYIYDEINVKFWRSWDPCWNGLSTSVRSHLDPSSFLAFSIVSRCSFLLGVGTDS